MQRLNEIFLADLTSVVSLYVVFAARGFVDSPFAVWRRSSSGRARLSPSFGLGVLGLPFIYGSAFRFSSSMGVGSSARCWSLSGGVGAAFASLRPSCLCCLMIGISTFTSTTISSTSSTTSGICWASEHSWSWVPRGGDDATVSGGEFGDVDPSPIPVGWGFDVVVSFAGRWSEGRFPPAFDDRLTGEECSWFGISDLIRSSPGDDLLATGNGVSGSTSLTDVIVGLEG